MARTFSIFHLRLSVCLLHPFCGRPWLETWPPTVYVIASASEKFSGCQIFKNRRQGTHQINTDHVSLSRGHGGEGHVDTRWHLCVYPYDYQWVGISQDKRWLLGRKFLSMYAHYNISYLLNVLTEAHRKKYILHWDTHIHTRLIGKKFHRTILILTMYRHSDISCYILL